MALRRIVAERARLYLDARAAGEKVEEQRQLYRLGWGLGYILARFLRRDPEWGTDRWVDYIVPEVVTIHSQQVFTVRGFAVWGLVSNTWREWADPVQVTIRLSSTRRRIPHYEAKFGDAELGLRRLQLGTREQLKLVAHPEQSKLRFDDFSGKWLFEFSD